MIDDEPTEARWLQSGDTGFARLVEKYGPKLDRVLARIVPRPAEREDLAQEVFLKVYRARNTFDSRERFSPWFYRVALNTVRDWRRRTVRHDRWIGADEDQVAGTADEKDSAETALIVRQKELRIQALVHMLPQEQREAIWLHYGAGLNQDQIAKTMEVPQSTVNNWLFRGREHLRIQASQEGWLEGGA